jgi:hypothetical protein
MNVADSRIVVTRPGGTAAGIAILPHPGMSSDGGRLIAGQSFLMYVARGTGRYQAGRSSGVLRPNTLVSAPAGTFRCEPDDDQFEMYVVVGGARAADPHDPLAFAPTFARRLDDIDGRRWRDRMADAALTAERGRLTLREAQTIADDALPLVWRPGRDAARATPSSSAPGTGSRSRSRSARSPMRRGTRRTI